MTVLSFGATSNVADHYRTRLLEHAWPLEDLKVQRATGELFRKVIERATPELIREGMRVDCQYHGSVYELRIYLSDGAGNHLGTFIRPDGTPFAELWPALADTLSRAEVRIREYRQTQYQAQQAADREAVQVTIQAIRGWSSDKLAIASSYGLKLEAV